MNITKETLKNIRKDVDKALEAVGKKYGVEFSAGNITYGEHEFSIKVDAKRTDVDVDRINFMKYLPYFSGYFTEQDYKATFADGKRTMQIIGLKPGNKYSVVTKNMADGKEYVYTLAHVTELMKRGA